MGNYISKVTPVRPVFGKKLDESNIIVGEEILETPNQSDLKQDQQAPNKSRDSLKGDHHELPEEEDEQTDEEHHTNGNHANGSHTNGFTNGQSNGHSSSKNHTNGHSENGNSIGDDNGHANGAHEQIDEEDELNGEHLNGKLNRSDLKSKKDDKQYSSKKSSLINEIDPVEPQPDEEDFEVVGRKRKGRKSATPKKQYKKRKNNLLNDLQKVNELEVDE